MNHGNDDGRSATAQTSTTPSSVRAATASVGNGESSPVVTDGGTEAVAVAPCTSGEASESPDLGCQGGQGFPENSGGRETASVDGKTAGEKKVVVVVGSGDGDGGGGVGGEEGDVDGEFGANVIDEAEYTEEHHEEQRLFEAMQELLTVSWYPLLILLLLHL